MEDINLHSPAISHAIGAAHNLLSALIDQPHLLGHALGIDGRRGLAPRHRHERSQPAQMVSSRARVANGFPREDGVDITVAFRGHGDLLLGQGPRGPQGPVGNIIVAYTRDRKPVARRRPQGHGPMAVDAEGRASPNWFRLWKARPPIHGGPFAKSRTACNSVLAHDHGTQARRLRRHEAGFGADWGGEKFIDIKCRKTGLKPDAVVW